MPVLSSPTYPFALPSLYTTIGMVSTFFCLLLACVPCFLCTCSSSFLRRIAPTLISSFLWPSLYTTIGMVSKIIQFLAHHGDIEIRGSEIYAKNSILYSSNQGASFSLKDSKSFTDKTGVIVDNGAIIGVNGGGMSQNEDGSITFRA
jgi:hypothetical protein